MAPSLSIICLLYFCAVKCLVTHCILVEDLSLILKPCYIPEMGNLTCLSTFCLKMDVFCTVNETHDESNMMETV